MRQKKEEIVDETATAFLAAHPDCASSVEALEFFYFLKWTASPGTPNKGPIVAYVHACCGDGSYDATFGTSYTMPDSYSATLDIDGEFEANSVWDARYGASDSYTDAESWTEPSKFGVKQYVVFSILGLMLIGCVVGALVGRKWYLKRKERRPWRGAYVKTPDKTRAMHEMASFPPGPEVTTDGDNTGRFIKSQGMPKAKHIVAAQSYADTPSMVGMTHADPPQMLSQLADE